MACNDVLRCVLGRNGDVSHGGDRTVVFVLAVDRAAYLTSVTNTRYLAKL